MPKSRAKSQQSKEEVQDLVEIPRHFAEQALRMAQRNRSASLASALNNALQKKANEEKAKAEETTASDD